jgi:hypothetical protein
MLNQRLRAMVWSVAAIAVIWILAVAGYQIVEHGKMTADKVRIYVESVDFSHLSAAERAAAIQRLAAMLNALSPDERRMTRQTRTAYQWFEQMNEAEKNQYIDATMPTGFKQMLASFEKLPEDQQRRVLDRTMKQLADSQSPGNGQTNVLSDELRQKIARIGLQTYYSESSAKTKAELAPLLEQMQKTMQGRALMRDRSQQ